jgi:hypothetical protein
MSDCNKCKSLFLEAFYEELDAQQNQLFKDHLQVCKSCQSGFDEMKSTLKFMSKRVRPEPGKDFWNTYEERLARRIKKAEEPQVKRESWLKKLLRPFGFAPKWVYQAAAALALIIVGVLMGRMIFFPPVSEIQQASQQPALITQQQPGTELVLRTQNYIERSKLILLALVNFDPAREDPYALDFPYQQRISRELVQEASFLKRELAESDQGRLENLIAGLEVILLQIANLESENDFEAIELVKEGVNSRGILIEINLTDLRRSIRRGKGLMPPEQPSPKPQNF